MNYIEKYLDNFWTINENAPLAEGKIDDMIRRAAEK